MSTDRQVDTGSASMTKKTLDGSDFLSVLHGAITTLNSLKTDERNYGYIEDEISRDSHVTLPNLQISPRGKKVFGNDSSQVTPRTRRRHSLMAPMNSARTTTQSSATAVTVEAESPSTYFWNNPAPPSEEHLLFNSSSQNANVSLPHIKSTYSGSVVSEAKTCFNLPKMKNTAGSSRTVCGFPLNKIRRSKSLVQNGKAMSDIRSIQMRRNQKNIFTLPRHFEARLRNKKALWKIKIFEREQPFE